MKPDPRFLNQPKPFWAYVRSISQHVGYTARGTGRILVPDLAAITKTLEELKLDVPHVVEAGGDPTTLGASLLAYFNYRAELLNKFVEPRLMDAKQAAKAFASVKKNDEIQTLCSHEQAEGRQEEAGIFYRHREHADRRQHRQIPLRL